MEIKSSKKAIVFLAVGLLLLLTAYGWFIYNVAEDNSAGDQASQLLKMIAEQEKKNETSVITVEGEEFCGTLKIKTLGIELPVFDKWDYAKLKTAPCRYVGGISTDNIIIAAHNYKSHFAKLKQLQIGDEILFVDAYGTQHRYSVKEIITLDGTAITDMKSGEWDFTLFTCTKGGAQRVTVRCHRVL